MAGPLSEAQLARMQGDWDAANYLVVGQIYLHVHALMHGRTGADRFHVHAVPDAEALIRRCDTQLARHHDYVRDHLDDIPEVRDWVWTD